MATLENTFVSVTELQKNTKTCLSNINSVGRKIILSNNKPQAILLSLGEFYKLTNGKSNIFEDLPTEDEIEAINNYEKAKKDGKAKFISSDVFFNSLENV